MKIHLMMMTAMLSFCITQAVEAQVQSKAKDEACENEKQEDCKSGVCDNGKCAQGQTTSGNRVNFPEQCVSGKVKQQDRICDTFDEENRCLSPFECM